MSDIVQDRQDAICFICPLTFAIHNTLLHICIYILKLTYTCMSNQLLCVTLYAVIGV